MNSKTRTAGLSLRDPHKPKPQEKPGKKGFLKRAFTTVTSKGFLTKVFTAAAVGVAARFTLAGTLGMSGLGLAVTAAMITNLALTMYKHHKENEKAYEAAKAANPNNTRPKRSFLAFPEFWHEAAIGALVSGLTAGIISEFLASSLFTEDKPDIVLADPDTTTPADTTPAAVETSTPAEQDINTAELDWDNVDTTLELEEELGTNIQNLETANNDLPGDSADLGTPDKPETTPDGTPPNNENASLVANDTNDTGTEDFWPGAEPLPTEQMQWPDAEPNSAKELACLGFEGKNPGDCYNNDTDTQIADIPNSETEGTVDLSQLPLSETYAVDTVDTGNTDQTGISESTLPVIDPTEIAAAQDGVKVEIAVGDVYVPETLTPENGAATFSRFVPENFDSLPCKNQLAIESVIERLSSDNPQTFAQAMKDGADILLNTTGDKDMAFYFADQAHNFADANGIANAQISNMNGYMYLHGIGIPVNHEEALIHFKESMALGHPNAEKFLDYMVEHKLAGANTDVETLALLGYPEGTHTVEYVQPHKEPEILPWLAEKPEIPATDEAVFTEGPVFTDETALIEQQNEPDAGNSITLTGDMAGCIIEPDSSDPTGNTLIMTCDETAPVSKFNEFSMDMPPMDMHTADIDSPTNQETATSDNRRWIPGQAIAGPADKPALLFGM